VNIWRVLDDKVDLFHLEGQRRHFGGLETKLEGLSWNKFFFIKTLFF